MESRLHPRGLGGRGKRGQCQIPKFKYILWLSQLYIIFFYLSTGGYKDKRNFDIIYLINFKIMISKIIIWDFIVN